MRFPLSQRVVPRDCRFFESKSRSSRLGIFFFHHYWEKESLKIQLQSTAGIPIGSSLFNIAQQINGDCLIFFLDSCLKIVRFLLVRHLNNALLLFSIIILSKGALAECERVASVWGLKLAQRKTPRWFESLSRSHNEAWPLLVPSAVCLHLRREPSSTGINLLRHSSLLQHSNFHPSYCEVATQNVSFHR